MVIFIHDLGGSANKTFLYQQTKALLNPAKLESFLEAQIKSLGTAACPPYHLAVVIGGLSAEMTLKTVKLSSTKYLDDLHTTGNKHGRAFRDLEWEEKVQQTVGSVKSLSNRSRIGVQDDPADGHWCSIWRKIFLS